MGYKKAIKYLSLKHIFDILEHVQIIHYDGETIASGRRGSFGYYDPEKKVIYIDSSRNRRSIKRTIMHELAHAYNDLFGAKDTESNARLVETNTWKLYLK